MYLGLLSLQNSRNKCCLPPSLRYFVTDAWTKTRSKNEMLTTLLPISQRSHRVPWNPDTNQNLLTGGLKLKVNKTPNLILPQSHISGNGNSILLATQTKNLLVIFVISLPSTPMSNPAELSCHFYIQNKWEANHSHQLYCFSLFSLSTAQTITSLETSLASQLPPDPHPLWSVFQGADRMSL